MLRVLTCLIPVNPRELSAHLRMERNYFTCIVELVLPPLVKSHLCFPFWNSLPPTQGIWQLTAEGLIGVNSHLCSVQSTLYGSQRLGVRVIVATAT